MNNHALFYNSSGGDRKYGADDFTDWARMFFKDGVFSGGLQVKANNDMTVTVSTGTAFIGGKMKTFAPTTLTLDLADGSYKRIDSIMIRRDDTKRDLDIIKVTGSPATDPNPPATVRSGNIHDIRLANIEISKGSIKITQANIKDTRPDPKECGWVVQAVEEVDFSQFASQFEAFVNEYKDMKLNEIDTWFNSIKDSIGTDAAVNLQMQIDELKAQSLTFQKKIASGYSLPKEAAEGDIFILLESE